VLIAYGIFADKDFYYRILERDDSLTISNDEVIGLIRKFYLEELDQEDYRDLMKQYLLQDLPVITYMSFKQYKKLLNSFSDEFKLLVRLV
jgi:hypothetical protein